MIPFSLRPPRLSVFALALSLCVLPLASQAQDTAAGEAPAAAPQAAQPAQQQQPPQPYFKDDIGDWRIRCVASPIAGQGDVCQLYQLLVDTNNNPVSEFTILPSPEGPEQGVLATVVTPLETLLPPGLRLSIDGSPEQAIPFTFCNAVGCYARFNLQPSDLDALKAGIEATISITPLTAPNQQVQLVSSLRGFTLALASVLPE